jgi:hypothetical protein
MIEVEISTTKKTKLQLLGNKREKKGKNKRPTDNKSNHH